MHYISEASSTHTDNFLPSDMSLLKKQELQKMLNFRIIKENTEECSETFLRWASAVLFTLSFEGSSRMCS